MRNTSDGRFLSRDLLGFLDGPSVYAYAQSRPHWLTDPTGLIGEDPTWFLAQLYLYWSLRSNRPSEPPADPAVHAAQEMASTEMRKEVTSQLESLVIEKSAESLAKITGGGEGGAKTFGALGELTSTSLEFLDTLEKGYEQYDQADYNKLNALAQQLPAWAGQESGTPGLSEEELGVVEQMQEILGKAEVSGDVESARKRAKALLEGYTRDHPDSNLAKVVLLWFKYASEDRKLDPNDGSSENEGGWYPCMPVDPPHGPDSPIPIGLPGTEGLGLKPIAIGALEKNVTGQTER